MAHFDRRSLGYSSALVMGLLLTGCFDGDGDEDAPPTMMPAPTPSPTPAPVTFDVTPCLEQEIPGTGVTVAEPVIPDTLTINLAAASGFPNGRRLEDPVVDVTLAVIFLDLGVHSPALFAGLPLNPASNDVPLRSAFPFLAPPQGDRVMNLTTGSNFSFNETDGFVRVDRMGMPAVATALIGSDRRNAYNDASPSDDANGDFVPDLSDTLTALTNALADDLLALDLTPCAVEAQT